MILSPDDISSMEKLQRVQLATSLPGAKPLCLVGTQSGDGITNLAPFSSITHLGSSPMLIGMVTRPDTVDRHTLHHILQTKSWTLNHVHPSILEQAHQCSARYSTGISEFSATGLTELFHEGIVAPFVAESRIRYALQLEDIIDIPTNGTKLIIGSVQLIEILDHELTNSGGIDLVQAGSVASTALDTYFTLNDLAQLDYAKPPSS